MTFQTKSALAFGSALLLLVFLGLLSFQRLFQERADEKGVEHTYLVLEKLNALQLDLMDIETGQCRLAMTKEDACPELRKRIAKQTGETLADLHELTSDNSTQQAALAHLGPLVDAQISLLTDSTSTNNAAALQERELAARVGRDHIRALMLDMKKEEQRLLALRRLARESSTQRIELLLAAGYVVSLVLLSAGAILVQTEIAKRRLSEQELRRAKEQNRMLFDSNPISIWVYDIETLAILEVNEMTTRHYGFSREEFLRLKITDLRPSEEIPALLEDVARKPQGAEDSGPWIHRKKSGEIIEVEIKSYPMEFAGRAARVVAALDVTERKRVERALRESQERFRLLVSNVKDYAILMLNVDGRIVSWNEGAERAKGYRAEEIIGQHFSVFYSPEDVQKGKPAFVLKEAARLGRIEDEGWRVRKDGSKFWANVVLTALYDERGVLRGYGKVTRDITERKRIEQMHLHFRGLFESLPGLYLVLTPDLKIAAASDAYLQATLTKREEILGQGIFDVLPDNPDNLAATGVANLKASLHRVLNSGKTDTMAIQKYDIRREDGRFEERFWSPINSPVFGADRNIEYIIHRVEDVTEFVHKRGSPWDEANVRERMEQMEAEVFRSSQEVQRVNQELRQSNLELESFSYSVSHDLRAPLRAIDGFSQALLEDYGQHLDATGQNYLQRVRAATQRMGMLIDDLLNLSRVTRAEMRRESVDLSELTVQIANDLENGQRERRAEFIIEPNLRAEADSRLMRVVLENLVGNAWKFTSKRECTHIEFGERQVNGTKAFFVRDNGAGFDAAHADRLFGPFQRLHSMNEFPGTGVGLATVQRIIHRHGGRVWAEGAVDQGATFYFTL